LSHCEGDLDIILNLVGPTLVTVNLGFTQIENMEINLLVSRAPNVTGLNLRQCTRIGHHGFVNLFRTLGSKLQELNLQGTSLGNEAAAVYCKLCTNLVKQPSLNLSWCMDLTNPGFFSLLNAYGESLRSLVVFNTYISNQELNVLPDICPNLEMLDVGGCYSVNDTGILRVVNHCKGLRELRTMDHGVSRVSGPRQYEIVRDYPNLETDFVR